ncbi:MAG: sulfurtransferase [Phycisphaerales bacterium]|nr:sulfurtransferase [Phycisphaerales bacterium]
MAAEPQTASNSVLVSTDWVHARLDDPSVKLLEVDVDTQAYNAGHIPGAVGIDWQHELQDQMCRDIVSKDGFERLMSGAGVGPGDTLVCYGDNNNWFAAYAFWVAKLYGHADVRLMDGGRAKWLSEKDKPITSDRPNPKPTPYAASDQDLSLRAFLPEVLQASKKGEAMIDVRSPAEYTGDVIAPPGMTETAQRAGHIPGARNVPWATAVRADGTFKPVAELKQIYFDGAGVDPSGKAISYCRIGERSSHTWFVLKYLLGVKDAKNYDGSWTEYGSVVGVPIER